MAYKKKKSKKAKRHVDTALVHVRSTFNNTIATVTTVDGDPLLQSSAGKLGYKGTRKGTPFVANQIGAALARDMAGLGIKTVDVRAQGPGSGRDSLIRSLQAGGITVAMISDVTPLPHNGVRAPKKRRV
jgi:small subunit ribosomal protein S11